MSTDVIHLQNHTNVRRWPRYRIDVPVRVIAELPGKTAIAQGRGNELNEGGMSVFAGIELRVNQQVAVEFTPPYSGQPIRARCMVRNRNGYTYGMEFVLENDNDLENVSQIRSVLKGLASARL